MKFLIVLLFALSIFQPSADAFMSEGETRTVKIKVYDKGTEELLCLHKGFFITMPHEVDFADDSIMLWNYSFDGDALIVDLSIDKYKDRRTIEIEPDEKIEYETEHYRVEVSNVKGMPSPGLVIY